MIIRYLFLFLALFLLNSCGSLKSKQYYIAYNIIEKELNEDGTKKYYVDALRDKNKFGLRVHDSIYFSSNRKKINKEDFLAINVRKDLKNKKCNMFYGLFHEYENSKWESYDYYSKFKNKLAFNRNDFKGPTHIVFFSSIDNNVLLADVLQNSPNLYNNKNYSGTVYKFYFQFKRLKIKDFFFVKNHYGSNW